MTLKKDYVARVTRLENIRLGREIPKPNTKMVRKFEKIRKILKQYNKKKPMITLEKLVAAVDLL